MRTRPGIYSGRRYLSKTCWKFMRFCSATLKCVGWEDLVQNGQNWQQSEMDVKCDNSHTHLPWGKTLNEEGKEVYATSLEAQYPRKFCYSLVQCIIRHLQPLNMQILPDSLFDVKDEKVFEMQTARITAQSQSRRSKLTPIMMWPPLQVSMSNSRQMFPFHCRASWISR